MELRHGSLQSSQKSRLTALPALPRACPRHHIGGQAAEAVRCWRPAWQARPSGWTATGTSRDSPPEWHGQRRQRVCTGFPGCFSFWRRLRRVCCRCCLGWRLLLWAGELSGSVGNSNWWAPSRRSQATGGRQPRTAQKDGEARRRNFPRLPGSAGRSRRSLAHGTGTGTTAATATSDDAGQHSWSNARANSQRPAG